jgi:predicted PhzF superfamily epimerase YddE/YHI9
MTQSSKEPIDGVRKISIMGDAAYLEQLAPKYIPVDANLMPETLASLGIDASALLPGHQPVVVNTGNSFLLLPLKDEEVLRSLQPDQEVITRISDQLDLIGHPSP